MHPLHPDLAWQQRIHSPPQLSRLPALAPQEADTLAEGVDAGIRSARAGRCRLSTHEPLEHGFKLGLHRAIRRLSLPPCEATPVVLDHR